MQNIQEYRVEVVPLETPRILYDCHKCKRNTEFYCSEKFRVNAQQKSLDVWLIYKCGHCDSTWNFPILKRVHTAALNKELHQKMMNNDRELAWQHAFEVNALRRLCSGVLPNVSYVLKMENAVVWRMEEGCRIILHSQYKIELRLDKLLCEILGISRSQLLHLADSGRIATIPQLRLTGKIKKDIQILIAPGT